MFTTENELYTKILISPLIIIETYLSFKLFSIILNLNYTKNQQYIYIFLISISSILTNFFIVPPFNVLFNYLLFFILIRKIFKLNVLKTFVAIIFPQLMFALLATLIISPFLKILNITSNALNNIPIYRILYLTISYILAFVIVTIIKLKSINIKFLGDLDKKSKRIFYLNIILGFFTICVQGVLIYYYINILPSLLMFFSFVSLLSYFGISFYSLTRVMKLQTTTRDLENAESYNETLQTLYDNVKSFKHDFDNMIHMLDGYLKNDDMEGLKEYYYDLTKDYDRVNAISVLNPNVINNPGIYNMLVSKYKLASDCDVKLHIEFFMDFNSLHMPIYEFSRVLGILLDNAIEAASECDDKIVNIMFRTSSRDNVELVKIENTFKNKDIDLKTIFKKDTSTKEKHMGMGLWEVNQIVNRFNNIKLVPSKDGE